MGITVLPTNIGGVSLNSIASPLASLINGSQKMTNLMYPSDLGSNPTMGHAVIIQAYDYKTEVGAALLKAAVGAASAAQQTASSQAPTTGTYTTLGNAVSTAVSGVVGAVKNSGDLFSSVLDAPNYSPQKKTIPYTRVSLFMPETQVINYQSNYTPVSVTKELGIPGFISHALSDAQKNQLKDTGMAYAASAISSSLSAFVSKNGELGELMLQGAGLVKNPQIQLLFTSVEPRTFQLDFLMTPKSAAEAETIKNICDSMAFYSLPGIAGGQQGQDGQFFTPPQVFSVDFQFLGGSGILNQISNTLNSALNSTGLNVLTSGSTITGGAPAKTFSVNDCFLTSVNVDYAPNGWAAYNDGYPVQTRLTLNFSETTTITKNQFKNSPVASNFNSL